MLDTLKLLAASKVKVKTICFIYLYFFTYQTYFMENFLANCGIRSYKTNTTKWETFLQTNAVLRLDNKVVTHTELNWECF